MSEPEVKSAGSVRSVDAVVAAMIFVFGAVVAWDSARMGARWGAEGPQAGYFPFYIGMIICVASIINFVSALRQKDSRSFVSVDSIKMVFSVLVPTTIYVGLIAGIGSWGGLGIYAASAVFIGFFMKWLGKYAWGKTVAVSIVVPIVFFMMFEIWFKVPLPKGPIEAALGLN